VASEFNSELNTNECNNTFQVVLASNGTVSYVIFNYAHLMCPRQDMNENAKLMVGLDARNNLTVISINELIGNKINQIESDSNVNINGKYILKVNK